MEIDADEIKKEKGHNMLLQKIHAERQHIRDLLVALKQGRALAETYAKQISRYKWQRKAIQRLKTEGVRIENADALYITADRKCNAAKWGYANATLRIRVVKEKIKNAQRRLSRLSAKFKAQEVEK